MLKFDLRNAYNTISRDACLKGVAEVAPSILAWSDWILSTDTPVRWQGKTIQCRSGVQQGSPLAPIYHHFATAGTLRDNILKTLKSFPALSAPGPSGLRAQHLVEVLHARTMEERNRFYLALENWIRASSSSKLLKWSADWLGAVKLVPLCQRQSTKIRSIAVMKYSAGSLESYYSTI